MTREGWKRWIALAGAFGIAGTLGVGLTVFAFDVLFPHPRLELQVPPATGLLVVCFALPLWRFVLYERRSGGAWGAVVAATIPVSITLLLAAFIFVSDTRSITETMYFAAWIQLLQLPLTLVLAVTGALVETTDRVGPVSTE